MLKLENKINFTSDDSIISDIQLGQKNLLKYEYQQRVVPLSDLSVEGLQDLLNSNKYYSLLKDSDFRVIDLYEQCISKKGNLLDLGDVLFNCTPSKLQELKSNGVYHKFKGVLDGIQGHKYLVKGNHDINTYLLSGLYDSVHDYLWDFIDEKYIIFTHYPLTSKNINIPEYYEIKELIDSGIDIINYHGHVHSNDLNEKFEGKSLKNVTYNNCCIDYYIKLHNL